SSDDVRKELNIKGEKGIVMISEGGRAEHEFERNSGVHAVNKWIEKSAVPLVAELYTDLFKNIFQGRPTSYLLLLAPKSSPDYPILKEVFTRAAKQLRFKTRFVLVDTDDEYNAKDMGYFVGYKGEQTPAVYGVARGEHGQEKFLPDFTEITTEN
ncbi:hypothetical protein PMAYCL1PPCAC_14139, partial [Pristionchus mayeri]